jgi:hypothetical protein
MAMLLDGPPSTIEDLTAWDADLLNVAVSEGIDLTTKLGLAASVISRAVETMLLSALPAYDVIRQRFPSLKHIAVTPQLKIWHTYVALRLVYQDLYYSRLNDRYQAKMKLYGEEESQALDELRAIGLGIVFDPVPQAVAPTIGTIQTTDAGGAMYIAVALVNGKGEEGLMSVPIEADTQDGSAVTAAVTSMAENAVEWNVYAGLSPDALSRQNSQTLEPLSSVSLAPGRLTTGSKPKFGQQANRLYPVPRRILRG